MSAPLELLVCDKVHYHMSPLATHSHPHTHTLTHTHAHTHPHTQLSNLDNEESYAVSTTIFWAFFGLCK